MDVDRLLCARVHSHPVCPLIGQGLGGQLRLAGFWAVGGWQGLGGQLEAGCEREKQRQQWGRGDGLGLNPVDSSRTVGRVW